MSIFLIQISQLLNEKKKEEGRIKEDLARIENKGVKNEREQSFLRLQRGQLNNPIHVL